mmetsp:Transcript_4436/g.5930  ORF Transcript_4436/g.5930 Transcript_4436/m.5930 type:complete len:104 (+) Transcript_4436:372-683(+)
MCMFGSVDEKNYSRSEPEKSTGNGEGKLQGFCISYHPNLYFCDFVTFIPPSKIDLECHTSFFYIFEFHQKSEISNNTIIFSCRNGIKCILQPFLRGMPSTCVT